MKFLRYLYYLLFVLGLFSETIQAKPIGPFRYEKSSIDQVELSTMSKKTRWISLFHLRENLKLAISQSSVFTINFSLGVSTELVDAWKRLDDAGLTALRKDPIQLQKFDDIVKNNNLGLDANGLGDLLKSPQAKGLAWDNPDKVLDAVKRSSDANIQGLSISHKKFPAPANGTDNFVLKNAKQYQAEASGDAALSFNKGGVSFDDVATDGKLVDRKFGHGASVFDKVEDDLLTIYEVKNQSRAQSILDQAQRQLNAVGGDGSKLRWEISTVDGAGGIKQLFEANGGAIPGIADIEVVYVAQQVIK